MNDQNTSTLDISVEEPENLKKTIQGGTISVELSEDGQYYKVETTLEVTVSSDNKEDNNDETYSKNIILRIPKLMPTKENDYVRFLGIPTCIIKPSYVCMEIDGEEVKYQEKYRKYPRNIDNFVQLFLGLIFNGVVNILKLFLQNEILNICINIGAGFSILTGITGIIRSTNGIRKALRDKQIWNAKIDELEQQLRHVKILLRQKDIKRPLADYLCAVIKNEIERFTLKIKIEDADISKHFARLSVDFSLIAVGISALILPGYALAFSAASITLILCLSLVSSVAMWYKWEIAEDICNIRGPSIKSLSPYQKEQAEFIKTDEDDIAYKARRREKFCKYFYELAGKITTSVATILLAFTTINPIALASLFGGGALIILFSKLWFFSETLRNGNSDKNFVTEIPNVLRESVKILLDKQGQCPINSVEENLKIIGEIHEKQAKKKNELPIEIAQNEQYLPIIFKGKGKELKKRLENIKLGQIQFKFDPQKSESGKKDTYSAKVSRFGIFQRQDKMNMNNQKSRESKGFIDHCTQDNARNLP